jgi:murein DD-endopeptidase MepM/ murein hydrolase activator NlpD
MGDVYLGWNSPVKEVVHPRLINLQSRGGLGWLEGFNEWMVRCGLENNGHPGVDFGERLGAPVLAAADGIVASVINSPAGCGHGVVIEHPPFERWTTYCHMHAVSVEPGQAVSRGEPIGRVGRSGSTSDVPHVHLELCTFPCASHADGDFLGTEDPLSIADGCYEADRVYPSDRLVVTFPVACLYWVRWR